MKMRWDIQQQAYAYLSSEQAGLLMLGHLYAKDHSHSPEIAARHVDRLDSWKQIASFFGREVRTVQLWEKSEGLPVWRHHHRKLGSVYAFRSELEAWHNASSRRCKDAASMREGARTVATATTLQPPSGEILLRMALAPFECLNGSPGAASPLHPASHFANGFEDELAVELGRLAIETVPVGRKNSAALPGSSSSLVKSSVADVNARAVLTGAIRCYENRVRIVVRLLLPEDLSCIWSERFDAQVDDLLDGQSEMASRISTSIPIENLHSLRRKREYSLPGEDSPQHACMMGRFFWEQRNPASLYKALRYFEDAVTINPASDDGYAGIADCYVSLSYSQLIPPHLAREKADRAVDALVRLGADSAEAHNCLANVTLNFSWDWVAAERQCAIACESYPDNSRGMQLYSIFMATQGRHQEAIDIALNALHRQPLSKVLNNEAAYAFYYAGDYKNGIPFVRRSIELDPEFVMGYALLGLTEMALDNWDEALSALCTGARLTRHSAQFTSLLAYAYARQGQTTQARNLLNQMEEDVARERLPAFNIAAAHLALNEKERALHNLRHAHAQRELQMICLKSDPRFTMLHSDTSFKDILASMSLA